MDNSTPKFNIVSTIGGGFWIEKRVGMGVDYLRDNNGYVRTFTTRASARKRISRERSGNFHA